MPGTDSVVVDYRAVIASAVQLLTNAGKTTIGLLAGTDTYTMRERRADFRYAVQDGTGLLPRAELVTPDHVSIKGGYAGLRRLLASAPRHLAPFEAACYGQRSHEPGRRLRDEGVLAGQGNTK